MSDLRSRMVDTAWSEIEDQAFNSGGYVDRTTGTIEGSFSLRTVVDELVERFGLVSTL